LELQDRLNVNFPVTTKDAARIALAFTKLPLGSLLELELSALQAEGRGKVISNPRVITSNNKEALIEQGTEIPYQQATSSGATSVSFKKAVLSLKVVPQITPDNRIIMDLTVNKDSVGTVFNGVPSINTRQVSTRVLVDNGQTVVLGGIYEQEQNRTSNRVPFLGDLPYVGALFRDKSEVNNKNELLIFVTPKIINEEVQL
jgi:type IV pilus assembly protein PilQ